MISVQQNREFGVILFVLLLITSKSHSALLHEECVRSSECQVDYSHCDENIAKCICRPYTVEYNATTCLPDAQCSMKVRTSGCVNGVCACGDGYAAYRRHTCLPPAKLGEICFDHDQCALADPGAQCKFVVPRVFGRCHCQPGMELSASGRKCFSRGIKIGQACKADVDCTTPNAYCSKKLDGSSVCTCEVAFSPSSDRSRCLPTYRGLLSPASLGYPCHSNLQCQLVDTNAICQDGICNCANSTGCNAKHTGCPRNTFQCHSDGKCISWYYVCDGKPDCKDQSDEICNVADHCPKQAYQCRKPANLEESDSRLIKCISKSRLCDKIKDCEEGDDEEGCSGKESCPQGTFQCATTKECLPEHHFCNSVNDCVDQSDELEQKCRQEFQPAEFCPFRCANGLCRSSAIVCSGVNGCGDNSDEKNCAVCRCPRII